MENKKTFLRVGHQSIDITYRYAHLFPTVQSSMAEKQLDTIAFVTHLFKGMETADAKSIPGHDA